MLKEELTMKSFEFARTGVAERNGLSHVQRSRLRQTGVTEARGLTVHFHHNSAEPFIARAAFSFRPHH